MAAVVWKKLAELTNKVPHKAWIKFEHETSCPATVEARFNLIGEEKMERFCNRGCSVICFDLYLDKKI